MYLYMAALVRDLVLDARDALGGCGTSGAELRRF